MAGERVNLLSVTRRVLEINGKSPADALWVGSSDGVYQIAWEEFAGKEWWEFKTPPRRQPQGRPFRTVFADPDRPRLATFRLAGLD